VRELGLLHEAFAAGKESTLPELPIQYADFAAWQRQLLQGETLDAQLSYWKRQLNNAPPLLQLPTDRPRPPVQSFRGARQALMMEKSLAEALNRLSRQEHVTLFMTLLAGFKLLLYSYTMQDDLIVGTAIAGRDRLETEGLIGCFVNTLVLRTDISGNPTFKGLLQRVRDVTLGAYAHQETPFEKLVDELRLARNLSHAPLFQVAFGVRNAPLAVSVLNLSGLSLSPIEFEQEEARFDLTVWVDERADGLRGVWSYATDLFDAETIRGMHQDFAALLHCIVAQPDASLSDLMQIWNSPKAQGTSQGAKKYRYDKFIRTKPQPITVSSRQ
jgi:non-ribosomal peptide synthetase component F